MAKIVRFHETGGPEVLRIEQLEVGEPGPEEVKIQVEAIGLNRAELVFRNGRYLERPRLPSGLGYEAAGVVIAVGAAVTAVRAGQRVGVIPTFSMNDYSTYGEVILVPAATVVSCPDNIDSATFAAVWMQYLTAYGALVDIGGVRRGDFVLITAASGSVGVAAIQIALLCGAVPIAVTRTSAKRDALLRAGAAHVIAIEEQDLVAEVKRITANVGARLVFDPVAGQFVETLAKATAQGGQIILYGGLSGEKTPFPGGLAMSRALTLRGYTVFELVGDAARLERAKAFILDGLSTGRIVPVIDRTFHFDEIVEAHRYMEASGQVGKLIVTVP